MKTFSKQTKIRTAIAAGLLIFCSGAFAATHLQQTSANTQVTLISSSVPAGQGKCDTLAFLNRAFFRLLPNGQIGSAPFELSAKLKQRLVVTDVEWAAYGGAGPLTAGNTLRLYLYLSDNLSYPVFMSRGIDITSDNAGGRPGSSEQLTSGFVVEPGSVICPSVVQGVFNGGASAYLETIILRGYLTK